MIHLAIVVIVVLAIVGLCWYLLDTLPIEARMKVVINVLLVLGLVIWLLLWVLPRLLALT